MEKSPDPSLKAVTPIEFRPAPEHVSVYANSANLVATPWDFAFVFGEITGMNPDTKATIIQEKVTVKMSPQHAKAFLSVLADNIKQYEDNFGEVRWQPKADETKDKT